MHVLLFVGHLSQIDIDPPYEFHLVLPGLRDEVEIQNRILFDELLGGVIIDHFRHHF